MPPQPTIKLSLNSPAASNNNNSESRSTRSRSPQPPPPQQQQQQQQPKQPELELESLEAREKAVLGVSALQVTLRAPPSTKAAPLLAKRAIDNSAAPTSGSAANLSRAKRPKAVKFSPAKASKRSPRVQANPATSRLAVASDGPINNQDYCHACRGKGHLLVCDGCPRSFHFSCLDPPLELDQLPEDAWYCKACESAQVPQKQPKKGLFGPLLDRLDSDTPQTYQLPAFILDSFEGVAPNSSGDFTNQAEFKPPRLNKAGFPEPVDPFKTKDKHGRPVLCYSCVGKASAADQKRIVSCDYCEQHWHLDCLNPPLATLPSSSRKWMCPLHSDHHVSKPRKLKPDRSIKVSDRNVANNGNVTILPRPQPERPEPYWHEQLHRGIRYQVPEDTLILDFWAKVRDPDKKILNQRRLAKQLGEHGEGEESDSSDLTSLDSDSDGELPAITPAASTSTAAKPKQINLSIAPQVKTEAMSDPLQASSSAPRKVRQGNQSPLPMDQHYSSASPSVAGSEADPAPKRAAATSSMEVDDPSSPAHVSKLPVVEIPPTDIQQSQSQSQPAKQSSELPANESSASVQTPQPAAGDHDSSHSAGVTPRVKLRVKMPTRASTRASGDEPPTKRPATDRARSSVSREVTPTPAQSETSSLPAGARGNEQVQQSNGAANGTQVPPTRHRNSGTNGIAAEAHSLAGVSAPASQSDVPVFAVSPNEEAKPDLSVRSAAGVDDKKPLQDFSVRTKDDLKALAHVRRLLREQGYDTQKQNVMTFLFGDTPVVPELQDAPSSRPGWNLPW